MDWTRTPNSNTYKFIFLPFPCTICSTHTPINTITTYQPQIGDQNDEFITKIASSSTTTPLNNQWTATNTAKKPRKPQKKKNKRRKNYEHLDGILEQEVVFGLPMRQRGEGPHGSARFSLEHRRTVWSRQGSRQRWKLYGPKKTPRSPRAIVPSLGGPQVSASASASSSAAAVMWLRRLSGGGGGRVGCGVWQKVKIWGFTFLPPLSSHFWCALIKNQSCA